jgi:hypothetical protein
MVTFYDEIVGGSNPLPVGIVASFYGGSGINPNSFVASGYVSLGGVVNVTLSPGSLYTATFTGTQAPLVVAQFTTDSSGNATCNVIGYRSPSLSSFGYAIEETNLWPTGWFSPAASSAGGTAYALAAGLGAVVGSADYMAQAILAKMRLQTCIGADYSLLTTFDGSGSYDSGIGYFDAQYGSDAIDTWAADFFGSLWTRPTLSGNPISDAQWVTLIQAILQTPKTTLGGIQQILTAWAPYYASAISTGVSPAMGTDEGSGTKSGTDLPTPPTAGSTVTYTDTAPGALSISGRNIIVFDSQAGAFPSATGGTPTISTSFTSPASGSTITVPTLNSYLGTSALTPGQFCVYFQNPQAVDTGIHPVTVSSTLLNLIVQNWKADGVNYINGSTFAPCLFAEN